VDYNNTRIEVINEEAVRITKAKSMMEYYSQFKLKPQQLKLLDLVMAYTDSESDDLAKVTFSIDILCKHLGMVTNKATSVKPFHMRKKVRDLCYGLMGTDEKNTQTSTILSQKPWFDKADIGKDTVTITLCSKLSEFLLINKNFGSPLHTYSFDCVNNLNNRESILLYMMLHAIYTCDGGQAEHSIEEIKHKLCLVPNESEHNKSKNEKGVTEYTDPLGNVVKDTMSNAKNFKRVILGQAIDYINASTNIFVTATMLPEGVPDTRKETVRFVVEKNKNYKGQILNTEVKKKKESFVTVDKQKFAAISIAEQSQIAGLKDIIKGTFGSASAEYIAIIDDNYPELCNLIDLVERVNWLVEIQRCINLYGESTLHELIRLRNVSPGLLKASLNRKSVAQIKIETSKLKDYTPKSAEEINSGTIMPKGKLSEQELDTISKSILKLTLDKYINANRLQWTEKKSRLENELVENSSYTSKTIKAVNFLMKIFVDKPQFAWCLFSLESKPVQTPFLPTLNEVQDILNNDSRISSSDAKGSLSRIIKDKVEQWLIADLVVVSNLAAVVRFND